MRSINSELETVVMELQDRLERLSRSRAQRGGASPSSESMVDMMTMSNIRYIISVECN